MAAPPFYDGSMATCEAFINACWIYIAAKPHEFQDVMAKIMWILSYMQTSMAQRFRDSFLTYMNSNKYQTDKHKLRWLNGLMVSFGNPNKQATAILELTTMKQGTKSAEEHIQLFKQAYSQLGYQETVGIHKLKRSLNTLLLDKCMMVPELPSTLDKWYELVIRLDQQWRQAVAERKTFATCSRKTEGGASNTTRQNQPQNNTQTTARPPAPLARYTGPTQDPNAMDINCNQTQRRCYNCGQPGHFARNCAQPHHQQTRLVEMWNAGSEEDRAELRRMIEGNTVDVVPEEAAVRQVQTLSNSNTTQASHFQLHQ
ncbi:hypothetical protein AMATHDRAFT_162044 [Amanita thiersii Skay4041]|uniref:CCHC-type domain-containing protein n=1 Tax=Amanita thiersii Skay4041 TaxID=703135 RepID=A0A2A9NBT7_9AGAR|nr:hypothetical protein AMATHDRAFT_162044 [Amanita thiersii Skay4041]